MTTKQITIATKEQIAAHGKGERIASEANTANGLPLSRKIFWTLFIIGNSYLWGHVVVALAKGAL